VRRGELTEAEAAAVKLRPAALYSPHCFRHTYGFTLVDAGIPITVIRDLMGHCSVTVTERYTKARSQAQHFAAVTAALTAGGVTAAAGPAMLVAVAHDGTPVEPHGGEPHAPTTNGEASRPGAPVEVNCVPAAA